MTDPAQDSAMPFLDLRPATVAALITLALALLAWKTLHFLDPALAGQAPRLTDFDVIHLAGRLAWEGRLGEAYAAEAFAPLQERLGGGGSFMPWTYPPPFDLLAAVLALMPVWLAYAAFTLPTFGAFLLVLRRLSGGRFPLALLAVLPVVYITIRCGQNGFLSAALIGSFALLALRGSRWAGLPLGLMVVKPHLALGLGLYLLLSRRWGWALQAAAVAALACLLSLLAFGPGAWAAFLGALRESKAFLESGTYPLYRMSSLYAGLRSLGLDPGVALAGQLMGCAGGMGMIAVAVLRRWRADRALAAAILGSLTVSPYLYDYDLAVLGIALALIAPDLVAHWPRRTALALLTLGWIAGGYGFLGTAVVDALHVPGATGEARPVALGAFALAALIPALLASLWKAERGGALPAGLPA